MTSATAPNGSSLSYGYDAAGNRLWMETPGGRTSYTYDAANRLQTVTDPWNSTTSYDYDPVGNLIQKMLPNGTATTFEYDQLDRLTRVAQFSPNGSLAEYRYTLGPTGNRLAV